MSLKTGWKTSEFWVAVVTAIITFGSKYFGWDISPDMGFVAVISYIISRGLAKLGLKKIEPPPVTP